MNSGTVNSAGTPRGRVQLRQLRRSVSASGPIFILLLVLVALQKCEARASDTSDSQRLIKYERAKNTKQGDSYSMKEEQRGKLYLGRSGDPWGTIPVKRREENVYIRVSSNSTYNDTRGQLTHEGKSSTRARFKRGVVHLYNMVVCATGCNPLAYKGYGCYCGFLGSGYVIDGIDRCCKMHDWCYDATECPMFSEYFVPYYWRCYHGYKPVCAVEHGSWGGSGSCAQRLCECDRSLAECLRRYPCPTTKAVCTSSPWRLVQNLFMIM